MSLGYAREAYSECCQTSKMKIFLKIISNFQPLNNLDKKHHFRCLPGFIFGNWFLEGLIHFSTNPFILERCLLLNVTFLLAIWLQTVLKKSLNATIMKFVCSHFFDYMNNFRYI